MAHGVRGWGGSSREASGQGGPRQLKEQSPFSPMTDVNWHKAWHRRDDCHI